MKRFKKKADLMAKNGLITAGVVEAARVILDGNIQQGQDEEIILILRAIYDVLLKELQKIRAPYAEESARVRARSHGNVHGGGFGIEQRDGVVESKVGVARGIR